MSDISKDASSGLEFIAVGETTHPKHVIVVLHGTGGNCESMKPIGELFAKKMPETLVLVPNGPVPLSEIDQFKDAVKANPALEKGRNWTRASKTVVTDEDSFMRSIVEITAGPVSALNAFVDGQLKKYELADKDLVIYGFSAGGMMALYTAIERPNPCAGLISHSGQFLGAEDAVSKPKTLMIFGDQEMANPQTNELFTVSAELLQELGLPVEQHVCKDLGHDINQESFDVACSFIDKALDIPKTAPASKHETIAEKQERLRQHAPHLKLKR